MNDFAAISEDKLLGLLWNASRDPSYPLWWCLDPKIKARFREEVAAMDDPGRKRTLEEIRAIPTDGAATYD